MNPELTKHKTVHIIEHKCPSSSSPPCAGIDKAIPVPVIGGDASWELLMSGGCWVVCCCVCCCCACCCCGGLFEAAAAGLPSFSAIFPFPPPTHRLWTLEIGGIPKPRTNTFPNCYSPNSTSPEPSPIDQGSMKIQLPVPVPCPLWKKKKSSALLARLWRQGVEARDQAIESIGHWDSHKTNLTHPRRS